MKANNLSFHTPSTPGMGSRGQLFFFSESGHVAYQNEGKEVLTNMQLKTLTLTHTPDLLGQILKLCR